jgi:phosphoribosyl-ATP pyrophosphohydrolase
MSIGNIDFLTLYQQHVRTSSASPEFCLRMCGDAIGASTGYLDNPDYDDVIVASLSLHQLQALYRHVKALLDTANGSDVDAGAGDPRDGQPANNKAVPKNSGAYLKAGEKAPIRSTTVVKSEDAEADIDVDDFDDYDDEDEVTPRKAKTVPPSYYAKAGVESMGALVDKIANNKRRDPRRIACRFLEEAVELVLATGATTQNVWSAVSDSIHNQALKASDNGRTVFPSQLVETYNRMRVRAELADVRLTLFDLCYVCGITDTSVIATMNAKFRSLRSRSTSDFVTDAQTFYLKKPHVNAPATDIL